MDQIISQYQNYIGESKTSVSTINDETLRILKDLNDHGLISAPRGMEVKELFIQNMVIDPTKPCMDFEYRKFNWSYFAGELYWYLTKDKKTDIIDRFSTMWKTLHNPGTNEINSNYGYILFGKQLKWVIKKLIEDNYTRKAVAFLGGKEYQFDENKDFVCTQYLNFWIRDGLLHMKVQMRSNDLIFGLSYDAPFFAIIQQTVLFWLNESGLEIKLGSYQHCVDNIHIYQRHYELGNSIINSKKPEPIVLLLKEPLFRFLDNTEDIVLSNSTSAFIDEIEIVLKEDKLPNRLEFKRILENTLLKCTTS